MTPQESEILAKVEVLADLEPIVQELMVVHEAKRVLWFPHELLAAAPDTDPDAHIKELRSRADGISLPARVALALNLLTEEGLHTFTACSPPTLAATGSGPSGPTCGRRKKTGMAPCCTTTCTTARS